MAEAQSRQPVGTPAAQALEAELDRIAALSLDEVRALWREMTRQNAAKALSRDLLARMIAYRVQERRLGRLGREMRKLLDRLDRGGGEPVRHLKVGTEPRPLIRAANQVRVGARQVPRFRCRGGQNGDE
jgi:Protein of unknown function (DUF2924)